MGNLKNGTSIRRNNVSTILRCVQRFGPISKRELQRVTGLSWGAVATISNLLLSEGYLRTTGKQITEFGRRPEEMDISDVNYYIFGIDLNISSGISGVVTDLKGRIIREYHEILPRNYEGAIAALFHVLDTMFSHFSHKTILGIGIAQQGFVDGKRGISRLFPHVKEWENVGLCSMLEERYHCCVQIRHDPDCILLAERCFGKTSLKVSENAVLLRVDSGIGMSLLLNGALYEPDGNIGEFGHCVVEPNGRLCSCGKKGCLNSYFSSQGIVSSFQKLVKCETTTLFADCNDISVIAAYAHAGDPLCCKLFAEAGEKLGMALSHLFNILCVETVVLFGEMTQYKDLYLESCTKVLTESLYKTINSKIQFSEMDASSPAIGGALTLADKAIELIAIRLGEQEGNGDA